MSEPVAPQPWLPGPALLFVPGDRPERYAKALERSDEVILDLEDAVAPERRPEARAALTRLADDGVLDLERTVVRVNGATTADHEADLEVVARVGVRRVLLAKAEDPDSVAAVPCAVVVTAESPLGVEALGDLAAAPGTVGVLWGGDDLVAGLGGTSSRRPDGSYRDVSRWTRVRALIAAKAHGKLAFDSVHMDIADLAGLGEECEDAVALGFDATIAIHPSQVAVIREAYTTAPERVDWARRLLAEAEGNAGVFTFEGQMVDGPIFAQARKTVQRAEAAARRAAPSA